MNLARIAVPLTTLTLMIYCRSALAIPASGCKWDGCPELMRKISGGNTMVFVFEIIAFIFVGLYVVTKIHDKWFK